MVKGRGLKRNIKEMPPRCFGVDLVRRLALQIEGEGIVGHGMLLSLVLRGRECISKSLVKCKRFLTFELFLVLFVFCAALV